MRENGVKYLLMGGQACVLYGAAEFSRDTDFAVLADHGNLARLEGAVNALWAQCIAVPPFEPKYLAMGLAVHFRCHHPDVEGMRIDVMSNMRGVDPFEELWSRRTTFQLEEDSIEVLSLPDLVRAKKTQRDKDWPMLSRLVEVNYFNNRRQPTPQQVDFWLRELRTPVLLREVARRFPDQCSRLISARPLLRLVEDESERLVDALSAEEAQERERDRRYWDPLRQELQRLRHGRREG